MHNYLSTGLAWKQETGSESIYFYFSLRIPSSSTNLGRISSDLPFKNISAMDEVKAVGSGLISMMKAPLLLAIDGRLAAGSTIPEVPTTSTASHCCTSTRACNKAAVGMDSPKKTASGFNRPPHEGQYGGNVSRGISVDG